MLLNLNKLQAQLTTSNCFDIQSILADACGSPEGENEMVRFLVGPAALNTGNLTTVTWATASLPYTGICKNATSAATVATLNASIVGCGFIKEPIGGVLPANSTVILATSLNLDPTANSFANLNDTIYIIFSCSSSGTGHFANYSGTPGTYRNLFMSFGGACNDLVTYDAHLLINQLGGSSAQDGATVNFDFAGNASYINNGCQAPIIPLQSVLSASNTTVCPGDLINISAVITTGNYSSVFWKNGNGIYGNTTSFNTTYQTNSTFTGIDALVFGIITNCNDTVFDTLNITINTSSPVAITTSGPTTFCSGGSVTLTANGSGSFLWSTGATTAAISATTTNTYTVTATSTCGISNSSQVVTVNTLTPASINASGPTIFCIGDSVTLSIPVVGTYLWSNGATTSSITVFTTNTYTVTITEPCGVTSTSQSVSATNTTQVNIVASGPTTFCQGLNTTLTASGATTYLWSNGATTASITVTTANNYTVTGTSSCGSSNSGQIITVNPLPIATINPLSGITTFCTGGNVTLQASGGTTYLWSEGSTTSSIIVTAGGIYTVTATNNCGNSSTSQLTTENSLPIVVLSASSSVLCPNDHSTITANSSATSYVWSTGETSNSINVNTAGTYTVTATNNCGIDLDSIKITQSILVANFIADSLGGSAPLTVHFTNTSQNSNSFAWDFGDGKFSTDTNPTHKFTKDGTYLVVLTVTDTNGCIDTASQTILVFTDSAAWIPNVFTPNGDQKNDVLNIVGIGIKDIDARIFNRWGAEVYSWSNLSNGWDGKYSGKDSPEGVYFYLAKIKYNNGKNDILRGNVTLLR